MCIRIVWYLFKGKINNQEVCHTVLMHIEQYVSLIVNIVRRIIMRMHFTKRPLTLMES